MQPQYQQFLREKALSYFLKYVQINSKSDPDNDSSPSSLCQRQLATIVANDLAELGMHEVIADDFGYVYAELPASNLITGTPISFIAHLDTSPSEPGDNVKPIIHQNYKGDAIAYPDNEHMTLSIDECPELGKFIGEDIITSSGKTLLGADDKAGIAEIMAACALFVNYPEFRHPELRIVFTPDEEIGRGVDNLDLQKLGKVAYTMDGGEMGELEAECFDAWSAKICFQGRNVHPGSAKNVMINAAAIAARFFSELPEWQTPEHTEKKEGFYHLTHISGDESTACLNFIIRDFNKEINEKRISYLNKLIELYLLRYPGLSIESDYKHSYQNMLNVLNNYPDVIEKAADAIESVGIKLIRSAIRGGTDGARLCYLGIPTPNIFTGGLMYHSRLEWIPVIALQKAAEVIVSLSEKYC